MVKVYKYLREVLAWRGVASHVAAILFVWAEFAAMQNHEVGMGVYITSSEKTISAYLHF